MWTLLSARALERRVAAAEGPVVPPSGHRCSQGRGPTWLSAPVPQTASLLSATPGLRDEGACLAALTAETTFPSARHVPARPP